MYFVFVALISSLLMSKFRILLQSHGRQSNSAMGIVGINILTFTASLLASTTLASCTTWLVQFYVSCASQIVNSPMLLPTIIAVSLALPVACVVRDLKFIMIFWFNILCHTIICCYVPLHFSYRYYNIHDFSIPYAISIPIHLLLLTFQVSNAMSIQFKVFCKFWVVISLIFIQFYFRDLIALPVPIVLLSKFIIVLWFAWNVGIRSSLQHKQNIFLIILVVCEDNYFLSSSYISYLRFRYVHVCV